MDKMKKDTRNLVGLGMLGAGSAMIGSNLPGTTGTAAINVARGVSQGVSIATPIIGASWAMRSLQNFPKLKGGNKK